MKKFLVLPFLLFVIFSCNKKDEYNEIQIQAADDSEFSISATIYKDFLDQGLRNNLLIKSDFKSRRVLFSVPNVQHIIYYAALNDISINKLILDQEVENSSKFKLNKEEILWMTDRWNYDSKAILNDQWSRPITPRTSSKDTSIKRLNNKEAIVYFPPQVIKAENYNVPSNYLPFYWRYNAEKDTINIPAIRLHMKKIGEFYHADLFLSAIDREKKWVAILDHPMFLWKGKIPDWALQSIEDEKYQYAPAPKEKKK